MEEEVEPGTASPSQTHRAWRVIRHGQEREPWETWYVGAEVSITMRHVSSGWRLCLWHDVLTLG